MTTDTLLTSGQTDTATASSQTATDAPAQQGSAPDAQQQQQSTDAPAGDKPNDAPAEGAKPEGDKPEGDKPDEDKPQGAPEEYADFSAPEGVALDAEVTTEFKSLAKELDLSQEAAQKVIDLGPKLMQKWQAKQAEALAQTAAQWEQSTIADPELGGDKLAENMAVAKKGLDTFGSPELAKLLHESGLGNHPEIIRAFYKAGKAISEDRFVNGASGNATPATMAQRMYPNMNP